MKTLLTVAAAGEAATGLALLVDPSLVVRLLVGAEIEGAGVVVSRVAGLALIGLSVACGPLASRSRALAGMLTYSLLVTLYLGRLGLSGLWPGTLLWPAVGLHAVFTALLLRALLVGNSAAE